MQLVRGVVPPIVARLAVRTMPEIESRWLATGGGTAAVGAGGAADAKASATPATTKEARP